MPQIYTQLNEDILKNLLKEPSKKAIIIKFSATWCKPCQKIKDVFERNIEKIPDDCLIFQLDIDDNFNKDLYARFKFYRMLKGIPGILVYYYNSNRDQWYVPDAIVNNSNIQVLETLFNNIYKFLNV